MILRRCQNDHVVGVGLANAHAEVRLSNRGRGVQGPVRAKPHLFRAHSSRPMLFSAISFHRDSIHLYTPSRGGQDPSAGKQHRSWILLASSPVFSP